MTEITVRHPENTPVSCDVFCRVVDNFGDAGVCWRLARSLLSEYGFSVTLYIDDPVTLSRITRGLDPEKKDQVLQGVTVRFWNECLKHAPSDAVIETFGCRLPDAFEEAIAAKKSRGEPVFWMNLEYLSAEDWVEECHGLPSPHPRLPVSKTFFFPGVTARTGGVMIEKELLAGEAAFSSEDRRKMLTALGAARPDSDFNLFFFSYPTAPVQQLAEALAADSRPCQVIAAPGEASAMLGRALAALSAPHVTFSPVPAVPQEEFDKLLWCCDALIIRGEDSFVRAQLSARPFLWTIYPQTEDTHIVKLKAFLARQTPFFRENTAQVLTETDLAWNQGHLTADLWKHFRSERENLTRAAQLWRSHLVSIGSLSAHISELVKKGLE